jgi:hypothetical protein
LPQADYPRTSDLEDMLTAEGFDLTGFNVASALAASIAEFEKLTGRKFLDPAGATTRTFDPPLYPRGMLDLRADLVAPAAGAITGSYQATALVLGTDWRLLPQDAGSRGRPFYRAQFLKPWWPYPYPQTVWGSLTITGVWAYGLTLPDDVWQAMLHGAALDLLASQSAVATGGAVEMREADMQVSFGTKPFQWLYDWRARDFDRTVAKYRRVTQF